MKLKLLIKSLPSKVQILPSGYGMKWNETEISEWNMLEWNGKFQEWNGRQCSIISYKFHTKFCT